MNPLNLRTIDIVICINSDIICFMTEYIMSLISTLNCKLLINNINNIYDDNNIYIFIQTIPSYISLKNIYLINIEQLTRPYYNSLISDLLNKQIKVIDYSYENIKFINNEYITHLPYQYTNQEIDNLKNMINNNNKIYDVIFVGCFSQKRRYIYDNLINNGINITVIDNTFGEIRDIEISRAKILLNIHCDENCNIYESMRCDRWIFAGMLVISELSLYNNILDINDLVIFEKYDNLVDKVIDVVKNYDIYKSKFIEKHHIMMEQIKKSRLESINRFKSDIYKSYQT